MTPAAPTPQPADGTPPPGGSVAASARRSPAHPETEPLPGIELVSAFGLDQAPDSLREGYASGRAARWAPTDALVRTTVVALLALVLALVAGRPDLLVIGLPFLLITVWSVLHRPTTPPRLRTWLAHPELREGQGTTVHIAGTVPPGTELMAAALSARRFQELSPARGALEISVDGKPSPAETQAPAEARGELTLRSTRWGPRPAGPLTGRFLSAWDAYSFGPLEVPSVPLWTLPADVPYSSRVGAPHPQGLVGAHSSRRRGTGVEFSDIRVFAPGDRLRHISWPVSLRTGQLHVTTGFAEQDAEVLLVVDALHDVGVSTGIDGDASSLDLTVRATAAVGTSFVGSGDRVGLQVIGTEAAETLRATNGRQQLRRILDVLARIEAGSDRTPEERAVRLRAAPEALVLMFSPVVSPVFLDWAVSLTRGGHQVIVVDTLGAAVPEEDPVVNLAWRLRMLERERELRRVQAQGVSVVPWHGAGSLDQILLLARRRRVRGGTR